MRHIELILGKDPKKVTSDDIMDLIKKKKEESSNLEYKDAIALKNLKELSKDISAFANSDGGLIIVGVSEEKVYPKEITWSDGSVSREALDQSFNGNIDPPVVGLKIVPIRKNEKSTEVIFLIDIPKSRDAPHTVLPSSFYQRLNFGRSPMKREEIFSQMKERLSYERCALFRNWLMSDLWEFMADIVVRLNPQHIQVTQTNINDLLGEIVEKSPDEIVEMLKELNSTEIRKLEMTYYGLRQNLDDIKQYPHNEITPEEAILINEIEEKLPPEFILTPWLSEEAKHLGISENTSIKEKSAVDTRFLHTLEAFSRYYVIEISSLVLKLKTKLDEMEEKYGPFFDYVQQVSE